MCSKSSTPVITWTSTAEKCGSASCSAAFVHSFVCGRLNSMACLTIEIAWRWKLRVDKSLSFLSRKLKALNGDRIQHTVNLLHQDCLSLPYYSSYLACKIAQVCYSRPILQKEQGKRLLLLHSWAAVTSLNTGYEMDSTNISY